MSHSDQASALTHHPPRPGCLQPWKLAANSHDQPHVGRRYSRSAPSVQLRNSDCTKTSSIYLSALRSESRPDTLFGSLCFHFSSKRPIARVLVDTETDKGKRANQEKGNG